jgi:Domain of Unknown Function with PDB structure (DUF3857)
MKNIFLASIMLICTQLFAQKDWNVSNIPSNLLKDAHAVIRLDQNEWTIKNPSEATLTTRYVVTFFSKPSENELFYAGQEGGFYSTPVLKAKIYDAGGNLIYESEKSEVKQYGNFEYSSFTKVQNKVISVQAQTLPFTVEFVKTQEFDGFFALSDNYISKLGYAIENYEMTIICPQDFKFKWKSINIDLKPNINTDDKNQQQYQWLAKNIPSPIAEPFTPYEKSGYSRLTFSQEQLQLGKYKGDASTWKSFGQFIYSLNNNRDAISPDMQAIVKDLTLGITDKRQIIDVIYQYLQENYRYVSIQIGVGGWQTLDAAFVEKNKYGDCKALSNYMKALLKVVGIQSYLCLVTGGDGDFKKFDPDFPQMFFNHMVLFIPEPKMWLECTATDYASGYLGSEWVGNREALVLTPDGGILKETPIYIASENKKISLLNLKIKEDGSAQLQSKSIRSGSLDEYLRRINNAYKGAELEKEFSKNSKLTYTSLSKLSIKPQTDKEETIVTFEAELRNIGNKTGKRFFLNPTKANPIDRTLPKNEERVHPLLMDDAYSLEDTIVINLPASFKSESMPEDKNMQSDLFGTYNIAYKMEENSLKVIRKVVFPVVSVPASQYKEAREFFVEVSKLDARQVVFVQ